MVIFYSSDIDGSLVRLDREESEHCVRVLRHHVGDEISVIDGRCSLLRCRLVDDNPKGASAEVLERKPGFGSHPYVLTMAVCPTKNIDRFEWFAEKATEIGMDVLAPVIGERSERKVLKTERISRLVLSAAKQSLKGAVPVVAEPVSVRDFILAPFANTGDGGANAVGSNGCAGDNDCCTGRKDGLKLICYCLDDEQKRISINDALHNYCSELCPQPGDGRPVRAKETAAGAGVGDMPAGLPNIAVLIGPEGDFSPEEIALAFENGWKPVHLGASRLRTETAALVAATAVYLTLG